MKNDKIATVYCRQRKMDIDINSFAMSTMKKSAMKWVA